MNEEKDIFCEVIKDKLDNYSYPVDNGSWEEIEQHLGSISKKKTRQRFIFAFAVAASIALLLYLIIPINKKIYHHGTAAQISKNEETIIKDLSEKETIQSSFLQTDQYSTVVKKSKSNK